MTLFYEYKNHISPNYLITRTSLSKAAYPKTHFRIKF